MASEIQSYLGDANNYVAVVAKRKADCATAAATLQSAIDRKSGSEEISLLIRIHEKAAGIRQSMRLKDLVDDVKGLKHPLEQTLGEVMEKAFTENLTNAVEYWYRKIQTTGDPDVHFDGFSMERTKAGDYKNAKVRIGARSYGKALASAVSSSAQEEFHGMGGKIFDEVIRRGAK